MLACCRADVGTTVETGAGQLATMIAVAPVQPNIGFQEPQALEFPFAEAYVVEEDPVDVDDWIATRKGMQSQAAAVAAEPAQVIDEQFKRALASSVAEPWDTADAPIQAGSPAWAGIHGPSAGATGATLKDVLTTFHYPMYCLPMAKVLQMDSIGQHEHLLALNAVVVKLAEHNNLFISQTWLRPTCPDKDNVKWKLLKVVLQQMMAGKLDVRSHWLHEMLHGSTVINGKENQALTLNGTIWFDFCSVPQGDTEKMVLAVRSIPAYISNSCCFLVLAPVAAHEKGFDVDFRTYCERGWCRTERVLNQLCGRSKNEVVVESTNSIQIYPSTDWITKPVGKGDFTVDGDRFVIGEVLDGVVSESANRARESGNLRQLRMLTTLRSKILENLGVDTTSNLPYDDWMRLMHFERATDEARSGWTPLRFAMLDGRLDLANRLLEDKADIDAPLAAADPTWAVSKRTTILHAVASLRHFPDGIRWLIEHKADLRARDSTGYSALGLAAAAGHIENFDVLATLAPEMYSRNDFGLSCLALAIKFGQLDMTRHIMSKWRDCMAADTDRRGQAGTHLSYRTPFDAGMVYYAVAFTCNIDILNDLLTLGYDIDARIESRFQAWPAWALFKATGVAGKLQGDRSGNLVEACTVTVGSTALMFAAFFGHAIALRRLLAAKANVTIKNNQGRSALHLAALKGHVLIVEALLSSGAAVGELDKEGHTAAMLACRRGHADAEQCLLSAGDVPPHR